MEENGIRDAEDYVSFDQDTRTLSVDHAAIIADLTGTESSEWGEVDGPDSGSGESHYWQHDDELRNARVNVDQGLVTVTVVDEDGDEIAEGSVDLDESKTWASNGGSSDEDGDDLDEDYDDAYDDLED